LEHVKRENKLKILLEKCCFNFKTS